MFNLIVKITSYEGKNFYKIYRGIGIGVLPPSQDPKAIRLQTRSTSWQRVTKPSSSSCSQIHESTREDRSDSGISKYEERSAELIGICEGREMETVSLLATVVDC